jgi:hypothetical protein
MRWKDYCEWRTAVLFLVITYRQRPKDTKENHEVRQDTRQTEQESTTSALLLDDIKGIINFGPGNGHLNSSKSFM